MMKKILAVLTALIMTCLTGAALASAGDRTLLTTNQGGGYTSEYVENAILSGGKIYLNTMAASNGFYIFDLATGESTRYSMEKMEERMRGINGNEEQKNEDGDTYTESIAGWFGYEGGIYAVVTRSIRQGEESEIDGGYIRKAVFADGQVDLEECEMPKLDWRDMIERSGGYSYSRYLSRQTTVGDWLAVSVYNDSGDMELHLFNLKTGDAETREIDHMNDLTAGPEGKLLIGRVIYGENQQIIIDLYDIEEDESETLARIDLTDSSYNGFAWNAESNTLYYISNGEIYAAPERDIEKAQAVNECSINASGMFSQMTEDGYMFVYGYDGAVLRNTDPAARGSVTIRMRPFIWTSGADASYYAFTESHGDIGVIREDYGDESTLLQGMMNKDDRVDLYTLSSNSSTFSALYDRGFLGDLSGSATLNAAVDQMYPFLKEVVTKDGQLVAFPLQMNGNSFGYNSEAWEKMGLTQDDLPRTWDELLDLIEKLPDMLDGTEYRAFQLWTSQEDMRNTLLTRMVQSYSLLYPDQSFNTPTLQRLMDRVMKLDLDALGMVTNDEMENIWDEFEARGGMKTHLLASDTEVGINSWEQNTQNLALSFEKGEDPVIPVSLVLAFLNPFSQHTAEAMTYIECMAENLDNATAYAFYPDRNEPLRYPDHEEQRKNLSNWVETAKKNIENAEDDETRETWEGYLEEMQKELDNFDETNWQIGPKAIAHYRERAQWLKPETYSYWTLLQNGENGEAFQNLWDGYAAGQKSVQELLSFMDQKIRMMRMEGN